MKHIIIALFFAPLAAFSQDKQSVYLFINSTDLQTVSGGGQIVFTPAQQIGIGFGLEYGKFNQDFKTGANAFGDLRFIVPLKNMKLFIAGQPGYQFYNKYDAQTRIGVKGGGTITAGIGLQGNRPKDGFMMFGYRGLNYTYESEMWQPETTFINGFFVRAGIKI